MSDSETKVFNIGSTPVLLIGKSSDRVFLFVHGLHGRKEESLAFAEVAAPKGYQVLGIDLPVERKPWEVLPLLNEVRDYLCSRHFQTYPVTGWKFPRFLPPGPLTKTVRGFSYMTSSLGFTGSVRRMIRSLSTDVTPLTFLKKAMASRMSFPSGILMAIPGMRL